MTLYHDFPTIFSIDDVLPHIDENFRVVVKGEFTFINYIGLGKETFPPIIGTDEEKLRAMVRRECRGIAFYTDSSAVASRPFHKFFNAGERDDVALSLFDFDRDDNHYILDKLDGSMIRPLHTKNGVRWGTKMGITDVGMLAEAFVADKPEYEQLAQKLERNGKTPLFEFCSRSSQIVIDYPEDKMVLLAIRDDFTGHYAERSVVALYATSYGIPVVGAKLITSPYKGELLATSIIQEAKELEGEEGYVIACGGVPIAKGKADWYVKIHRAKDMMRSERHLVDLILAESVDDLLPALSDKDKDRISNYVMDFGNQVRLASYRWADINNLVRETFATKKDFALSDNFQTFPAALCRIIFCVWDGKMESVEFGVKEYIEKSVGSEASFQEMKEVLYLNTGWNGKLQVEE